MIKLLSLSICFVLLSAANLLASVFYADPSLGNSRNTGTSASPWKTLQEVLDSAKIETRMYAVKPFSPGAAMVAKNAGAPVKAGDTIMLRNGYHGAIFASEYYNSDYITIMAQPGQKPWIANLELRSGCKWRVKGLFISPEKAPVYQVKTLINFASHSWTGESYDCIAEACSCYSVIDDSRWTEKDWDTLSCDAMSLPGTRMVARGNYFHNVNFGISVDGDSCLVERNTINHFASDGLRGLGDYDTFQYNTVKNCLAINDNHDDGFQSWSVGAGGVGTGVVKGMVLRGNTIINYEDPAMPFKGTMQGIGCFDGMFEDWLIENNVVLVDHWHGITLLGAKNCTIINNTVGDVNTIDPGPPWIYIGDHKDSTHSSGCVIRNNLSTAYIMGQGVLADHNITYSNYNTFFVDYAHLDMRLKAGCAAVDSGSPALAPAIDIAGISRPQGNAVDVGAHELPRIAVETVPVRTAPGYLDVNPSPFNSATVIRFANPDGNASLVVFDITGKVVARSGLIHGDGFTWNAGNQPCGVYIIRLEAGKEIITRSVCLER